MLTTSVSTTDEVLSRTRAGRYAARHVLWNESGIKRFRLCGRTVQSNADGVSVRVTTKDDGTRSAGWGGVQSCGSVWACPVCSAKIAEGRRSEIAELLTAHARKGGRVAFATFTMSHRKGQALRSLWDALAYAWSKMTSGRGWQDLREHVGGIDWVRVVEVTKGRSGWHVHVHALLLLPETATSKTAAYIEGDMFGRWARALKRRGLSTRRTVKDKATGRVKSLGADVRMVHGDGSDSLADYFTKATYEVARGDMKDARHGGRTPFRILADIVETGDAESLDDWHEWERASKGRRQVGYSRGVRDRLTPGWRETTDQELSEEGNDGVIVAELTKDEFYVVTRSRRDYFVLAAWERSDEDGWHALTLVSSDVDRRDVEGWRSISSD